MLTASRSSGQKDVAVGIQPAVILVTRGHGTSPSRVFPIPADRRRISIGSAPECDLQLEGKQVGPVHWTLYRGVRGLVAKCWAGHDLYNGQLVSHAVISVGDWLGVGPFRLRFAAACSPHEGTEAVSRSEDHLSPESVPTDKSGSTRQNDKSEVTHSQPSAEKTELPRPASKTLIRATAKVIRRLEKRLDKLQQAVDSLAEQIPNGAEHQGQHSAPVEHAVERVSERLDQFARTLQAATAEQGEMADRFAAIEQQLGAAVELLEGLVATVRRTDKKLERRLKRLGRLARTLAKKTTEPQTAPTSSGCAEGSQGDIATAPPLEDDRTPILASSEDANAPDAGEAGKTSANDQLAAGLLGIREVESDVTAADEVPSEPGRGSDAEVEFETPRSEAPASALEVLRKLGIRVPDAEVSEEDKDDPSAFPAVDDCASGPDPARTSVAAASATGVSADVDSTHPDGSEVPQNEDNLDDEVQQYLSQLLQRIKSQGSDSQESENDRATKPAVARQQSAGRKASAADVDLASGDQEKQDESPAEADRPRRVPVLPPEKSVDLNALRQVANISAKSALWTFARRKLRETQFSKLLVTVVASAAAGILYWIYLSWPSNQVILHAAAASAVIALLWFAQLAAVTGWSYLFNWRSRRHRENFLVETIAADLARQHSQQTAQGRVATPAGPENAASKAPKHSHAEPPEDADHVTTTSRCEDDLA